MNRAKFRFWVLIFILSCNIFTIIFTSANFGVIYSKEKQRNDCHYNKIHTNQPQNSSKSWWNPSYSYRIPINITNTDAIVLPEGYSVNISVNTANLISAGKLREDGNDLRIAWFNSSGNTWLELDRVNETDFNNSNTLIWFKTKESINPSAIDSSYFLYYGNPNCYSPPANRSRVYDYHDDFTQANGDADGWTVTSGTSWTVVNNQYRENQFVIDRRSILDSYTVENASIEVRVMSSGGTNLGLGVMFRYANPNNFYTAGPGFWDYEVAIGKWTGGTPTMLDATAGDESSLSYGQWYNLRIDALGSNYLVYLDSTLKNSISDTDHLNSGQIGFMTYTTSSTSYFDDIKIRLLVSAEPTTTIGLEEKWSPSLDDFKYYKQIIIDHNQVSGSSNLIDFPVLISLIDSDLHNHAQPDGDDIVFFSGNELLDHEIEVFNHTYNSTHAQLVAWVRIPSLSYTTDTTIFIYYGNSAMQSCENATGVWNDNYRGVWHLNEISGNILDSTNYNIEGIVTGNTIQGTDGKIDGCYEFDGESDEVALGDPTDGHLDFGTNSFTVSFWVQFFGSTLDYQLPFYKGGNMAANPGYEFETNQAGTSLDFQISDGITQFHSPQIVVDLNGWSYIVGVVDRSADTQIIYKNGTQIGSATDISSLGSVDNSYNLLFSWDWYSIYGKLDEVRISSTARSADWITTEYNNQHSTDTFYSIGEECITLKPDYFKYYKEIAIDHTKVSGSSALLNFPLLVSLFDSDLQDHTQQDGDDIAFYNGIEWLNHEIELFNQEFNGTHAQLVAWVCIPSLSATSDTTIYMYYGNSTISSQENPEGVWNYNYKGVWHLKEDPSLSGPQIKDSTSNYYHGTSYGSMTSDNQVEGQVGGSVKFDGLNDYINLGPDLGLKLTNAFTIEAWYSGIYNTTVDTRSPIYSNGFSYSDSIGIRIEGFHSNSGREARIAIGDGTSYDYIRSDYQISDNIWTHLVGTYDGTTLKLYINGTKQIEELFMNIAYNTNNATLGINLDYMVQCYEGLIDEFRILNKACSADWITTEYNNQFDPNSFYNLSSAMRVYIPTIYDFNYYKEITIDHMKVSGSSALLNFPVLVSILDSDLHDYAQADGDDIAFYDGSEWLDHEIELYSHSYSPNQAQLVAWVRIPSLSPFTDTKIYMYYGNSTMESQENPLGVWDNNYVAIYHLNDAPSGIANDVLDSTFYGNDGITNGSMDETSLINSQIGMGFKLDGVDDFINTSKSSSLDSVSEEGTLSLWINWVDSSKTGLYQRIMTTSNRFNKISPFHRDGFEWAVNQNGDNFFYPWGADGLNYNLKLNPFTNGIWHNLVLTLDYSIKNVTMYLDGSPIAFDTVNVDTYWTQLAELEDWLWGASINITQLGHFEGKFDEIRVSKITRSADWIATEYNNQYSPNSFYAISSAIETYVPTIYDFSYLKEITIDHTKVSGFNNLLNFPVLISILDSDLHDHTQIDGDDIAFYNGTEWLDHELEIYNQSYNLTHAQLVVWVRIPSLSTSTDTKIYMYYGNSTMESQENPLGVWDDNYVGVWHLSEDSSGTIYDSTSNNNDGTSVGDVDQVGGKIDGSLSFHGANDYINCGNSSSLDISENITIEHWIMGNDFSSEPDTLTKGTYDEAYSVWISSSGEVTLELNSDAFYSLSTLSTGVWNFITCTYDGTTRKIFINGTEDNSGSYSTPIEIVSAALTLSSNSWSFDGIMDEVRISNIVRSPDWLETQYYNQNDPNNFYSIGTENIVGEDTVAPEITINSPNSNELFGSSAPDYDLTVTDANIDSIWYSLDGGITNSTPVSASGTIDQTLWSTLGNGTVTIRFYANDTLGNISYEEVIVRKDILEPSIIIDSPNPNELFGSSAPDYDLTIIDANLDSIWYSLDGGTTNSTPVSASGTIDQTMWSALGNGTVTIRFYANDTLGNTNYEEVIDRKDILEPSITINSPNPNELFGSSAPDYDLTVTDANIDSIWYSLDGGTTNSTPVSASGTIDQTMWSALGNGTVTIRFYANDTLGNTNYEEVIVRKDIIEPSIAINSPNDNDLFSTGAPDYDLTITDANLDSIWYSLDGGTTNSTPVSASGTIDQAMWNALGNGTVTIRFYANDSLGNTNYEEVIVRKDIILPFIDITTPSHDGAQIGGSIISISGFGYGTGSNIVSMYVNDTRWGDGSQKPQLDPSGSQSGAFMFSNNTYIAPGFYWIEINITDTAGNFNTSVRYFEVIIEDLTPPILVISSISPDPTNGFTEIIVSSNENLKYPPLLNITLPNSSVVYRPMILISALTWSANYSIDADGVYTVRVNGTDDANNVGYAMDSFVGDITPPSIIINNPNLNDLFGTNTPAFDVAISDSSGISTQWYTIDGGITNYTFVGSTGTIDQLAWNGQGNGTIIIKFYANDTAGNIWLEEVIVRKDISSPSIIITSPNPNELFGTNAPTFDVTISDSSGIGTQWYTIDDGNNNYTFIGGIGTIDQLAWSGQGNGTIDIRFYANDTVGNIWWQEVSVRKDILNPNINIMEPNNYDLFGNLPPNVVINVIDPNLDEVWYQLDNGTIITINNTWTGVISQSLWDQVGNGTVIIRIYANDTLGNLGTAEVIVYKDILIPIITINTPGSDELYSSIAPNFTISISGSNLNTTWYTLNDGLINHTFTGLTGIIDQTAWDAQVDGIVIIKFFINNTLGFLGFDEIAVRKDTLAPQIIINLPSNNTYYGIAPIINILATDANLDAIWYEVNTINISLGNNVNQQLDTSIWNSLPDGEFNIYIYANDSIGYLNDLIILTLNKDTTAPSAPLLINFPQGEVSGTLIFEWQAGSDPSGISKYRLIIDTEANPFATPGFVFEINITNNYYEYTGTLQPGTYYFCLYQIDGTSHQSSASTGSFIIKSTIQPSQPSEFPLWIIFVIIGAAVGGIVGAVVLKKSKSKKIKPIDVSQKKSVSMLKLEVAEKLILLDYETLKKKTNDELYAREKVLLDNIKVLEENQSFTKAAELLGEVIVIEELLGKTLEIKSYRQKQIDIAIKGLDYLKREYEKESKKAALSGDYSKSLELYKESQMISENLKVYLESQESSDSIEDIAIQSEVISEPLGDISIVYTSINDLLTKYFDEIGIKYYSNPQLYNNLQKQVHGLILNEDKSLIENLDTKIKDKIKAIQIIYTDNVSYENVKNLCKEFQNSYMMLIIVGIAWEESIRGQTLEIPKDKHIKYYDNIKIIHYDLFSKLLGLSDNYEIAFNEIISLYKNSKFDILQQSHNLSKIKLHNTEELLKDLKEKKLIKKSLNDYFKK